MYQTNSFHPLGEYELAKIALEVWEKELNAWRGREYGNVNDKERKPRPAYADCVKIVREAHSIRYDVATSDVDLRTDSTTIVTVKAVGNPEMVDRNLRF